MLKRTLALLAALLAFNQTQAMEGVFDRSAEIDSYVTKLSNTTSHIDMIQVAKDIYISGINDERLLNAISERLMKDLPSLDSSREDTQYGAWMVKAVASTGSPNAISALDKIDANTKIMRIKSEVKEQRQKVEWQGRKNEVMSSRKNYHEGDRMKVAQLLNLLQSDDYSLKNDAVYRMSWDKELDPRLMENIAAQLQAFVDKNGVASHEDEIGVMSQYVKMLGYSSDKKYIPLLNAVKISGADLKVKGQLRKALERLGA